MQSDLSTASAARIARLRRLAAKMDLRIEKSRCRSLHMNNLGGFMVVDASRNTVVAGERYEYTVDDLADYLESTKVRFDSPTWGVSQLQAAEAEQRHRHG